MIQYDLPTGKRLQKMENLHFVAGQINYFYGHVQ